MLVSDFDYDLPPELIAQKPLAKRDQSRMMVILRKTGEIIHSQFQKISDYLDQGEILVVNDSKVIPAKVYGKKDGNEIEFLFLKECEKGIWQVLCRPAKKVKWGDSISFSPTLKGKICKVDSEGKRVIQFSSGDVLSELRKIGFPPLPPYIKRKKGDIDLKPQDLERYQTVFAEKEGSIAAPTAGLHFTSSLLSKIEKKGIEVMRISLDVGLATFQPVRVNGIEDHKMLEEKYAISQKTSLAINSAKKESRPIVAVGTTSVRALESAFSAGKVHPGTHTTKLFIYPGYEFRVIDRLLTNFHLPKSTLLMLVAAFTGLDLIKKSYEEAIQNKYRFYSYGDCMLIL